MEPSLNKYLSRSNFERPDLSSSLYRGSARVCLHSFFSLAVMKNIVLIIPIFASVCAGAEWSSLKVTFKKDGSGYHDLPWSVKEATSQGKWVKIDEDKYINADVYSQPEDPRLMLLFDKKGTIAGLRTGFLKEDVESKARTGGYPFGFDYSKNAMFKEGNYFGKDLWHITVLFASPKTLASGGRNNLKKGAQDVAEGLFFQDGGKWTEISRDECKSDFVEGKCFAGMGKHYFYNLDEKQDCSRRQPFFALYDQGRLAGVGLSGYGTFTTNPKTQSYFEDFPAQGVRTIMPRGPQCMEDYINKYGLTMMHVFLKKDADKVACPPKEWRSAHC